MIVVREPIIIKPEDFDRSKYVGSSNVAAIMGLTPEIQGERYTSLDVYLAKIAGKEREGDGSSSLFLTRRKRWEGPVFEHLREEFDVEIVSTNLRARHPDYPMFAAEADFRFKMDAATVRTLGLPERLIGTVQHGEVKTVSPFALKQKFGWGDPWTRDVPIHYDMQCQFAMDCWDAEVTILAALIGLDSMLFFVVPRDEEDIAMIRSQCLRFWNENVLQKVPPEPQTLNDLDRLYERSQTGVEVPADSEIASKAFRLRAILGDMEARVLEAEMLEFEIKRAMGTSEVLTVDGRKMFKWAEQNWGRLDQEGLKKNEKAIYKKYSLSGRHRVFTRFRST